MLFALVMLLRCLLDPLARATTMFRSRGARGERGAARARAADPERPLRRRALGSRSRDRANREMRCCSNLTYLAWALPDGRLPVGALLPRWGHARRHAGFKHTPARLSRRRAVRSRVHRRSARQPLARRAESAPDLRAPRLLRDLASPQLLARELSPFRHGLELRPGDRGINVQHVGERGESAVRCPRSRFSRPTSFA